MAHLVQLGLLGVVVAWGPIFPRTVLQRTFRQVIIPAAALVVLVVVSKPSASLDLLKLVNFVKVVDLVVHVACIRGVRLHINRWHPTVNLLLPPNRPLKVICQRLVRLELLLLGERATPVLHRRRNLLGRRGGICGRLVHRRRAHRLLLIGVARRRLPADGLGHRLLVTMLLLRLLNGDGLVASCNCNCSCS